MQTGSNVIFLMSQASSHQTEPRSIQYFCTAHQRDRETDRSQQPTSHAFDARPNYRNAQGPKHLLFYYAASCCRSIQPTAMTSSATSMLSNSCSSCSDTCDKLARNDLACDNSASYKFHTHDRLKHKNWPQKITENEISE